VRGAVARLCALSLAGTAAAQPATDTDGEASLPTLRIVPRCETDRSADEIVVCGSRDRTERYRLPIRNQGWDPKGPVDSVHRERRRLIQEGDEGIGSCSTVGPGGIHGCFHRNVKRRCEQEKCGVAF